jgi:hypothetical protein
VACLVLHAVPTVFLPGLSPVHGMRSPHPSCGVNPIRGAHLPCIQPQSWWQQEEPARRISRSAPGTGAFTCAVAACTNAPRASSRAQQRRRLPVRDRSERRRSPKQRGKKRGAWPTISLVRPSRDVQCSSGQRRVPDSAGQGSPAIGLKASGLEASKPHVGRLRVQNTPTLEVPSLECPTAGAIRGVHRPGSDSCSAAGPGCTACFDDCR